jgi:hypothetical protein
MENKHFIAGQRYLFYHQAPYEDTCSTFRANFIRVINTTLLVNSHQTEKSSNTIVSIPVEWITKVERLEDIIGDIVLLPSDVLLLIDNFN